jgi:putative FmdB family regulatory protein
MPVYEYECENCHFRFEKWQRFSDEPLIVCPNCAGLLRKVIGPVGVIFKGSGFYVTDNRGKSSTAPPTRKDEGGKPGETTSTPGAASESTPSAPTSSTPDAG